MKGFKIVAIVLCIVLLLGATSVLLVSANEDSENFFENLFGGDKDDSETESKEPEESLPAADSLDANCEHEFDSGVVYKAAKCVTSGVMKYTCAECKGIKYESISAPGHDWDDGKITIQGSCTEKHEITYTCKKCGSSTVVLQSEIHPNSSKITVVTAFSELKHEIETKCGLCGKVLKQEIVPHSWDDGVITKAATCEDGEMLYTCECGATKTVAIAGSGHTVEYSYDIESETKHSVTETCSVCDQVLSFGTKTESHSWSNDQCVKCGATR